MSEETNWRISSCLHECESPVTQALQCSVLMQLNKQSGLGEDPEDSPPRQLQLRRALSSPEPEVLSSHLLIGGGRGGKKKVIIILCWNRDIYSYRISPENKAAINYSLSELQHGLAEPGFTCPVGWGTGSCVYCPTAWMSPSGRGRIGVSWDCCPQELTCCSIKPGCKPGGIPACACGRCGSMPPCLLHAWRRAWAVGEAAAQAGGRCLTLLSGSICARVRVHWGKCKPTAKCICHWDWPSGLSDTSLVHSHISQLTSQ